MERYPQVMGYEIQANNWAYGPTGTCKILLSAVLAILFFAVSNYINQIVANTGFRAKEIATRRLFGSTGIQISLKLIAESTLMVAIAFTIGLGLAFAFEQDAVSLFRGKIDLASDINFSSVCLCLGFILLVGVVTGMSAHHLHGSRLKKKKMVCKTAFFNENVVHTQHFHYLCRRKVF